MKTLAGVWPALARIPLRRIVFAVCIGTWVVRALFLSVPDPLSIDELSALTASEYGTASRFINTTDWAERWDIANHFRQWHILWTVPHSIWGYLFPSNGQMAYALTQASALVAMLALAGAARHLYGERGFLLCLLLASISPLALNYTVRALGTMPAAMWVCLALFFFTSPRWSAWSWIGGGLCLGLAFGASFGAGAAILAIAGGLGVSVLRLLLAPDIRPREKIWKCGVGPVTGAIVAVLPLVPVELSARYAGSTYSEFLRHHTMLVLTAWLGPYGLWLRELLELDPLLQVILFAAMAYTFRTPSFGGLQKTLLGTGYALMLGLLVLSTDKAAPRVFVSLGLFALVGVAVGVTRILERGWLAAPALDDEIPVAPPVRAPFDRPSLAVSIAVLVVFLTLWRNLSNMPRVVFPSWPLLVLAIVGLTLRVVPSHYPGAIRGTALLGSLLFLMGAGATYHAKSAHSRSQAYAAQHPYMKELTYQSFWRNTQGYGRLSTRARYDLVVIGPLAGLYPASVYEEDPFKILFFRSALKGFGLEHVLTAEQMIWASIFYEESRPASDLSPPPGTPEAPEEARGVDADAKPFVPRIHPYRGIELRFPAGKRDQPAEMSATIVLPADPGKDGSFGFELMAFTPYVPAGTRLTVSVFQGDRGLGSTEVRIIGSEGKQADASVPLYELPRQKSDPFRLFRWPVHAGAKREEIRIVARLERPPVGFTPPVSCYIRRPYIYHP